MQKGWPILYLFFACTSLKINFFIFHCFNCHHSWQICDFLISQGLNNFFVFTNFINSPITEMGFLANNNLPRTLWYLLRHPADHSLITYSKPKNNTNTISWKEKKNIVQELSVVAAYHICFFSLIAFNIIFCPLDFF